jgi:hypothetical protein
MIVNVPNEGFNATRATVKNSLLDNRSIYSI